MQLYDRFGTPVSLDGAVVHGHMRSADHVHIIHLNVEDLGGGYFVASTATVFGDDAIFEMTLNGEPVPGARTHIMIGTYDSCRNALTDFSIACIIVSTGTSQ